MNTITGASPYATQYPESSTPKASFGCAKPDAVTFSGSKPEVKLVLPREYYSLDKIKPLLGLQKKIRDNSDGSIPPEIIEEGFKVDAALHSKAEKIVLRNFWRGPSYVFNQVMLLPIEEGSSTTLQDWIIQITDDLIEAVNRKTPDSVICDEASKPKKATLSEALSETQAGEVLKLVLPLQGYTVEVQPSSAVAADT